MDHLIPKAAFGFSIRFRLTDGLGEDGALELWDDFVAGPVGGRGLAFDSGAPRDDDPHPDPDSTGLTRRLYRPDASATEDDRRAVREWARRRGEIAAYDIGPLTNLVTSA